MLPTSVEGPLAGFESAARRLAGDRLAAIYLVGSPALGDFSDRQSNLDVVVVADPPLLAPEVAALRREERRLERAGRPAVVWYTGWEAIAGGPGADRSGADPSPLETPLTRFLLRDEAVAVTGPDWPVVAVERDELERWCRDRLLRLAADGHGLMVLRRRVGPLVLEAARLAVGARTGRVVSKSEGGHAAGSLVPPHFRRILTDSVGYRNGATTSMYWGPFERKYDAQRLIVELARSAG